MPAPLDAARDWLSCHRSGDESELADPRGKAFGRVVQHPGPPDVFSLELYGLSDSQLERVLRVLSLGSAADHCLEHAMGEAAPW